MLQLCAVVNLRGTNVTEVHFEKHLKDSVFIGDHSDEKLDVIYSCFNNNVSAVIPTYKTWDSSKTFFCFYPSSYTFFIFI